MTVDLNSRRMRAIPQADLSERQRIICDNIIGSGRSSLGGPFLVWLRSPELAERAQYLGALLRFGTTLPPRLSELAILVVAAHWRAQYEWFAHAPIGVESGLHPKIVEQLRAGEPPEFSASDERLVFAVARSLSRSGGLDDETYAEAVGVLTEQGLVELVGIVGYYTFVAFTLNAFGVDVPDGEARPFATTEVPAAS